MGECWIGSDAAPTYSVIYIRNKYPWSNRYSFLVPASCSDRVLKQGEEGNAGRANLQFHSTNVVIGIVS